MCDEGEAWTNDYIDGKIVVEEPRCVLGVGGDIWALGKFSSHMLPWYAPRVTTKELVLRISGAHLYPGIALCGWIVG